MVLYRWQNRLINICMAKIQEEIIVIKISRLLRDTEQSQPVLNPDVVASLEAVVQELAGSNVLVETTVDT